MVKHVEHTFEQSNIFNLCWIN